MFKRLFSKSTTIPVLRLSGIISSQSGLTGSGLAINNLEKLIDKLFADKKTPVVGLIINSPGGSPTQSSLIAKRIIDLAKEKNKKVLEKVRKISNRTAETPSLFFFLCLNFYALGLTWQ